MLRLLGIQLKKLFCSPLFYCAAVTLTVLLMLSPVRYNSDSGNSESVIYCILNYSFDELSNKSLFYCFSFYSVFNSATYSNTVSMFIPILAAIGAVNVFADERNSKIKRLIVVRTGHKKYIFSNIIFFMISGGLVCLLGYGLFGLIISFFFPHINDYPPELIQGSLSYCSLYKSMGINAVYTVKLLLYFIYGMTLTLPALVLVSFLKNKYLIVCIPFFLKYALNNISNALISKFILTENQFYEQASYIINPEAITTLVTDSANAVYIIAVNLIFMLVSIILTAVIMLKEVDKGE